MNQRESAKRQKREPTKQREREPAKQRTTSRVAKSLPLTDGLEPSPTKCTICERRGRVCHVNPKATKAAAACFECNHWRLKCSLAPSRANTAKRSEFTVSELSEDEEAAASKEQSP